MSPAAWPDVMGGAGPRTVWAVDASVAVTPEPSIQQPAPSGADVAMRRLLRVPVDASGNVRSAQSLFSASIAVSAVRCLITYVMLPLLAPVLDLTGGIGPVIGLVVGTVSMVAVVIAVRRFWLADHAWRWRYTVLATGILVLLTVGAVQDVASLVG